MPLIRKLNDNQLCVNAIRAWLGKGPLYIREAGIVPEHYEPTGAYVRLERRSRLANPDCKRCDGSGYYDGEELDQTCPCTGLPQRAKRYESTNPRSIARRKHHAPTA